LKQAYETLQKTHENTQNLCKNIRNMQIKYLQTYSLCP
jgi:hypothetical protein